MTVREFFKRLKPQLVEDWRDCWRWYSTHALMFNAAMITTWLELPAEWKAVIPVQLVLALALVFLALGFVGRLIEQVSQDVKS